MAVVFAVCKRSGTQLLWGEIKASSKDAIHSEGVLLEVCERRDGEGNARGQSVCRDWGLLRGSRWRSVSLLEWSKINTNNAMVQEKLQPRARLTHKQFHNDWITQKRRRHGKCWYGKKTFFDWLCYIYFMFFFFGVLECMLCCVKWR